MGGAEGRDKGGGRALDILVTAAAWERLAGRASIAPVRDGKPVSLLNSQMNNQPRLAGLAGVQGRFRLTFNDPPQ